MAHQEKERRHMCKIIEECVCLCTKAGVQAEKLYKEMITVENGLVELITRDNIDRLVMGAAADNKYSRKMMKPKSIKADYVCHNAPDYCHIWFVCKGRLIYTREGTKSPLLNYKNGDKQPDLKPRLTQSSSEWSSALSRVNSDESIDNSDQSSTFSLSHLSLFSRYSGTASQSTSVPLSRTEDCEAPLRSNSLPPRHEETRHQSQSPNLLQTNKNDSLHDQLNQAIEDVKNEKQETFQDSYRRDQAETEAADVISKANAAENSFHEEMRKRKELEDELAKTIEELENTKKQRDIAIDELQIALKQSTLLKCRSEKSDSMEELEDKLRSTLELPHRFRQL